MIFSRVFYQSSLLRCGQLDETVFSHTIISRNTAIAAVPSIVLCQLTSCQMVHILTWRVLSMRNYYGCHSNSSELLLFDTACISYSLYQWSVVKITLSCTVSTKHALAYLLYWKSVWLLKKHQLDHIEIICISFQMDNHTSTTSPNSYRPNTFPESEPMVSKHWW